MGGGLELLVAARESESRARSTSLLGSVRGLSEVRPKGRCRGRGEGPMPLFADQTKNNCPTGFDKR
jgi:hypothetical protein